MFKELFRSAGSVVIIDATGVERLCVVQMESRNDQRQQYTLRVGGSSARWGWVAAVPAAGGWAGGRGGYRGGRVVGMHLDEQGQGPWAHWGAGCAGTCTTSGIACFASGGLLPSLSFDAEIHLLKPAHPLAAPAMAPHNHTHHPSIHPPTTTSHPHCQPPPPPTPLQGRFSEVWDALGVQAGDALSFRMDPLTCKVTVLRHAGAAAAAAATTAAAGATGEVGVWATGGWRWLAGGVGKVAGNSRLVCVGVLSRFWVPIMCLHHPGAADVQQLTAAGQSLICPAPPLPNCRPLHCPSPPPPLSASSRRAPQW